MIRPPTTARSRVAWLLAAELAVLVATGVALHFDYRPTAAQAWDVLGPRSGDGSDVVRELHRVASVAFVVTAAVSLALHAAARHRHRVTSALLVALGMAGIATGFFLPWDQLALWAVTVGTDYSGYTWLFGDDEIRFVLIGGKEIGLSTLRRWYVIHFAIALAAVPVVVALGRKAAVPMARAPEEHETPAELRGPGRI